MGVMSLGDEDDICFILNQHTELDLTSSLIQHNTDKQKSDAILLNAACYAVKQKIQNLQSVVSPNRASN